MSQSLNLLLSDEDLKLKPLREHTVIALERHLLYFRTQLRAASREYIERTSTYNPKVEAIVAELKSRALKQVKAKIEKEEEA